MKRINAVSLPVFIILVLTACEPMSWDEWDMPPYDGLFNWTELTEKAEWCNRMDHAGAAFNDRLWIFGGYANGQRKTDTYLEDIWSSADGISWTLENKNAPWKGRRGHSVVVFDNGSEEALFLIGGFEVDENTGYRQYTNDVWKSINGIDWIQIKERTDPSADTTIIDWMPRFNHACIRADIAGVDYLYLIGGSTMRENYSALYSMKYHNDVWRSKDAVNWEKVESNDFGSRTELAAFWDPTEERIIIHGGVHSKLIETENKYYHPVENYDCIWSSTDGSSWETDTSFTLGRAGHELFLYQGNYWIFPGKNTSYKKFHMAWGNVHYTYRKIPGGEWILDSEGSDFNGRHSYARVIFNDKVYIMGGETGDMGYNNDVWCGSIDN